MVVCVCTILCFDVALSLNFMYLNCIYISKWLARFQWNVNYRTETMIHKLIPIKHGYKHKHTKWKCRVFCYNFRNGSYGVSFSFFSTTTFIVFNFMMNWQWSKLRYSYLKCVHHENNINSIFARSLNNRYVKEKSRSSSLSSSAANQYLLSRLVVLLFSLLLLLLFISLCVCVARYTRKSRQGS